MCNEECWVIMHSSLHIVHFSLLNIMNPTQLSRELREGQSPELTNRRWIIGLSLLGAAAGQVVTLYQK